MYIMKNIKLSFICVLSMLMITSCASKQKENKLSVDSISEAPVNTQAEEVSVKTVSATTEGKTTSSTKRSDEGSKILLSIPRNGKPTIVDFSATWCGPCRMMAPIFDKLATELSDKYNFVSIDVDENPQLAAKYQIQSIPAFIFLDEDGIEGDRKVGACSEAEFRDLVVNGIWY